MTSAHQDTLFYAQKKLYVAGQLALFVARDCISRQEVAQHVLQVGVPQVMLQLNASCARLEHGQMTGKIAQRVREENFQLNLDYIFYQAAKIVL